MQLRIVERCYELQAGSNLAWNEPVHALNQYPTGNHPDMILEIKAKITCEPLVRSGGIKTAFGRKKEKPVLETYLEI